MTSLPGITFYNRAGEVISLEEWGALRASGETIIEKTVVDHYEVSTVLLGLDHSFDSDRILIFETMIFDLSEDEDTRWNELYVDRYSTEQEAIEGHARAIEVAKGLPSE